MDDSTDLRGKKIVRRTRAQVYRLWLAALRSGEYKQAKRKLRDGDGFCCLGVLCDLARKDGGPKWEPLGGMPNFMGGSASLPDVMLTYLGIGPFDQTWLMSKNDSGGSFSDIADYIERDLMPRANAAKPSTTKRRSQVK